MKIARKHDRVTYSDTVEVKLYRVSGEEDLSNVELECQISDISAGGIRLSTDRVLPTGTMVDLRVSLKDPISAFVHKGEIRWNSPSGSPGQVDHGIMFHGSEDYLEEWARVVDFMARREPSGDDSESSG